MAAPPLRTSNNNLPSCAIERAKIINVGSHRNMGEYKYNNYCSSDETMFPVAVALGIISIICCLCVVVYLVHSGLAEKQKFFQICYLFTGTIFANSGFIIMILYRSSRHVERMGCIFSYTLLGFSSVVFYLAVISLTFDCFIAVFFPLKYRTLMTKKTLIIPNIITLILFFGFYILYPMIAFPSKHGGYMTKFCSATLAFPKFYLLILAAITFILNAMIILLNKVIVFGVLWSLIKRSKISTSESSIRKSMTKLSVRLVAIILFNFGFTLPMTLKTLAINIFDDAVCFALVMSLGLWNTLIFVVGDAELRQKVCKRTS